MMSVVVQVGVQLIGEKLPPLGRPLTLKVTDCGVPEINVAEIAFVTDCPATTD